MVLILAEVIITVGHWLKSGQLAGLPPVFGLTNVRLNSKLFTYIAVLVDTTTMFCC